MTAFLASSSKLTMLYVLSLVFAPALGRDPLEVLREPRELAVLRLALLENWQRACRHERLAPIEPLS